MPRSRKKRQTRLTLTPLSSSSTAASSYPVQIKERAAAVRYGNHGRSAKRRCVDGNTSSQTTLSNAASSPILYTSPKVVIESPQKQGSAIKQPIVFNKAALPTPEASSQVESLITLGRQSSKQMGPVPEKQKAMADAPASSDDEPIHTPSFRRKLFSGRTKTTSASSEVLSDSASPVQELESKITHDGSKATIGGNSAIEPRSIVIDDERIVISSSEDESDRLTERARLLPTSKASKMTEISPQSQPKPSRRGRPKRATSRRSIEASTDTSLPTRLPTTRSPTKPSMSAPTSNSSSHFSNRLREKFDLTRTELPTSTIPKYQQPERIEMASISRSSASSTGSDEVITPTRRRKPAPKSEVNISGENDDDIRGPISTTRRRARLPKAKVIPTSDETTTSSEDVVVSPVRKGRLQRAGATTRASPRRSALTRDVSMSEGDDDDIRGPASSSRRRATSRKSNATSFADETESSNDEEVATSKRTRKRRGRLQKASDTPKVSVFNGDDESMQDIQNDLEDLKETEVRNTRTRGSQRTPKKTKAQEQLELIRRRRAGRYEQAASDLPQPDETPSRSKRALYDTTSSENSSQATEVEEEEEEYSLPIRGGEDLDTYDEDFIVDDEDGPLGAPSTLNLDTELPFEFTRHAHKKPFEHFKDVVEWMVHNKLNPAFPRDDPSYRMAFRKLDDEVQGLAGSKYISAAWGGDFLTALKTRPDIAYLEIGGFPDQHCAACNKSNHPAKFQLIFSGKPYDRHTLEDIEDDEDGDDAESDTQTFSVGRTCCANSETAHALHHWRHALNSYITSYLRTHHASTSPQQILARESWSQKRRTEYADGVVDAMVASGEVGGLYREFKENLKNAREVRNQGVGYGRR